MSQEINLVTFGMFIIDEIEYTADQKPQLDLIGGAGTYAALGARLAVPSISAKTVSWIVDIGSDFPPSFKTLIESWGTSCVFRHDASRLTTRAWNGYGPDEHRDFKYLTPKIRLEVSSLTDDQANSKSFHMVCSPSRCIELSGNLRMRRRELNQTTSEPIIIWEPIPDLCTPAELANLQAAARMVNVVSPNADELAQFFGSESHMAQVEMVTQLMGWDIDQGALSTHVVVREGAQGSTVYFAPGNPRRAKQDIHSLSISAYHDSSMAAQVVDPTGGGNTYLGALAVTMACSGNDDRMIDAMLAKHTDMSLLPEQWRVLCRAAVNASIAASYAIEQCGTPAITSRTSDQDRPSEELWNGESFRNRMEIYLEREEDKLHFGLETLTQSNTTRQNGLVT